MTKRLSARCLLLVRDERTAIAVCTECGFKERYTSKSTPRAYENSKRHAESMGHTTRVTLTHIAEYQPTNEIPDAIWLKR